MTDARLIFLPGMGADERLFFPQRERFDFECPPMPVPHRNDDLPAYAARLRDQLEIDESCILIGVSFGGMVAYQLGSMCPVRCVVQIASCRSPRSIPRYYTLVELVSRLIPTFVIQQRCRASSRLMGRIERLNEVQKQSIRDMAYSTSVPFLRRVGRMILNWSAPDSIPCPAWHIHGARDVIIPLRRVRPDVVIEDGGHLINMTHAERVNAFIAECIERVGVGPTYPVGLKHCRG
jgi:pimeloyl-ACP methyl ester carboxylesterase